MNLNDVAVTNSTLSPTLPIAGSVSWNAATYTLSWIATANSQVPDGILPNTGTYNVTLTGLTDARSNSQLLGGFDGGGSAGTPYTWSFTANGDPSYLGSVSGVGGTTTGYSNGQVVTLSGGTSITPATVSLTTVTNQGLSSVNGVGGTTTGYTNGQVVSLSGGTYSTPATVQSQRSPTWLWGTSAVSPRPAPATAMGKPSLCKAEHIRFQRQLRSRRSPPRISQASAPSAGPRPATPTGSRSLYQAGHALRQRRLRLTTVNDEALGSATVAAAGSGYSNGQTVTLSGGTYTTPATVQLTTVTPRIWEVSPLSAEP